MSDQAREILEQFPELAKWPPGVGICNPGTGITNISFRKVFSGPPSRFFDWDESDEWYLRWSGLGKEVDKVIEEHIPYGQLHLSDKVTILATYSSP